MSILTNGFLLSGDPDYGELEKEGILKIQWLS
jgi:hypothetical protein